jgi:hypothetical protein
VKARDDLDREIEYTFDTEEPILGEVPKEWKN